MWNFRRDNRHVRLHLISADFLYSEATQRMCFLNCSKSGTWPSWRTSTTRSPTAWAATGKWQNWPNATEWKWFTKSHTRCTTWTGTCAHLCCTDRCTHPIRVVRVIHVVSAGLLKKTTGRLRSPTTECRPYWKVWDPQRNQFLPRPWKTWTVMKSQNSNDFNKSLIIQVTQTDLRLLG